MRKSSYCGRTYDIMLENKRDSKDSGRSAVPAPAVTAVGGGGQSNTGTAAGTDQTTKYWSLIG